MGVKMDLRLLLISLKKIQSSYLPTKSITLHVTNTAESFRMRNSIPTLIKGRFRIDPCKVQTCHVWEWRQRVTTFIELQFIDCAFLSALSNWGYALLTTDIRLLLNSVIYFLYRVSGISWL
jgi:hypothetical protein